MFFSNATPVSADPSVSIVWADFPETDFSGFDESDFYGSVDYLTALRKGTSDRSNFLFPKLFLDNACIAFGCFQEIIMVENELDALGRILSSDSAVALKAESVLKSALKFGAGKTGLRMLVAGNSQVTGPYGLFFKKGISEKIQSAGWKAVIRSLEKEFESYHFILIKDIPNDRKHILKTLPNIGFKEIPVLPVMKLCIESSWCSMHDYLDSFSAKYRTRAHAAIKKGGGLVREIWDKEKIIQHINEIESLYKQVYDKARFRLFRLNPDYFSELKSRMGDKVEFKAYLNENKLVGFTTSITGNGSTHAHLVGMDYEANRIFSIYQNMLYDYVETSISNQSTSLDLGRTAMEIKSTIGAIPFEVKVFIKLKNPIFNHIACLLLENVQPEQWIQRHPFKVNKRF